MIHGNPMGQGEIKEMIVRRWDYSSRRYDGYPGHGVHSREEARAWENLFEEMLPEKGLRILEVGCGTGEMSLILAALGHEVHGLDLSSEMLARARDKAAARFDQKETKALLRPTFHMGDAENPPFPDDYFDVIFSRHLMWTLPDPQTAAGNWARRLKPEGRLMVVDARWDDDRIITRLKSRLTAWLILVMEKNDLSLDRYSDPVENALPHARGLPLETARLYLERAGFGDLQTRQLDDLIGIQKKHMPWRYRISYAYDYWTLLGHKVNGSISP
jgi:ubiquinone/menaquinone biosynthesis C-methylase UbiE